MIRMIAALEKPAMPRKGEPLTSEQISLLRGWIDQGAEWPDEADEKTNTKTEWWSFLPALRPAVPAPQNRKWPKNDVDRFILSRLEEKRLLPSPETDRVTLIRRLTYDLHGLPPSAREVADFTADKKPGAYERLVDRLLASPRYGERWARHWLDTVHFGETHGYDKDKPRGNAWPYRDYVIRSFNQDKPYSRFVREQLAGDVLYPEESDGIAALGFIAAGPWDFVGHVELPIEKSDGLIARYNDRDDMVMTTMSTFQSLTVHCARCHNHKFDPISQKDYYALQSVFAGVDRADRDFDLEPEVHRTRRTLLQEQRQLKEQLETITAQIESLHSPELDQLDAKLLRVKNELGQFTVSERKKSPSNGYHSAIEKTATQEKWVQVDLGVTEVIDEIRLIPARPTDFPDTPGFGFPPRLTVEFSQNSDFSKPELIAELTGGDFANPGDEAFVITVNKQSARCVRVTARKLWERSEDYVFALAELQIFSEGTNVAFKKAVSALDSIEAGLWSKAFLVDGFSSRGELRNTLPSKENATRQQSLQKLRQEAEARREAVVEAMIPADTQKHLVDVTHRLDEIKITLERLPPLGKVFAATSHFEPNGHFIPAKGPRKVHLLTRGDVKRPAEEMAPAGLGSVPGPVATFEIADPNNEALRRAALAQWITDPKNMLTRRSIVNRIWHYHFGRGIVETPNDFGHMGAQPSHPELLDWLAFWFLENGESFKKLHKLIVMSATYRQSSETPPPGRDPEKSAQKIDADNRFLWRMNRSRLDAESLRDTMLMIGGQLDLTMGGPSVQQFAFKDDHSPVYDYANYDPSRAGADRRSIYRFVVRSVPDPLMDSLDCPDASILTPVRNTTMTALQALAVLNDPLIIRQAGHFATRLQNLSRSPTKRIELAYQLALNRKPSRTGKRDLLQFSKEHGLTNACRVIFNMSEFSFID